MEYWLHYVGKGLYKPTIFIREAKKYRVNRAIPWQIARKLKWNEIILLAYYIRGKAWIFGYFKVENISHTLPMKHIEKLHKKLNIREVVSLSKNISRACGSYTIVGRVYVDNTVEEVVDAIIETAKEVGVKVKVFVGGNLWTLRNPIVVNAPFTRSLTKIKLDVAIEGTYYGETEIENKTMYIIDNYNLRHYLTKREREKLMTDKLDRWLK